MRLKHGLLIITFVFSLSITTTAHAFPAHKVAADTTKIDTTQKDIVDVIRHVLHKPANNKKDEDDGKATFAVVPAIGYTLSTGFIVDLSANATFYTNKHLRKNISFIDVEAFYDSKSQQNLFSQSVIWANQDKLRFVTDARFLRYPDDTYGLGSFTTVADDNPIRYNYIRLYETVLRKVSDNFFMGGGYNLDYHFKLTEEGTINKLPTDFDKYGFASATTSSGLNFAALYDSRPNPIRPLKGTYANFVFRQNTTILGSNTNWESIQFDYRHYFKLSPTSDNVLAIWNMEWFNFNGLAPYMDLPSTGWDTFNNLGRGYEIGRFRGRGLLYIEAEYRYGITHNGLLGGVVFANGQSFSDYPSGDFKRVIPSLGAGLRIKVNKLSNTNICIDYAYGFENSKGFFVNLGEMF